MIVAAAGLAAGTAHAVVSEPADLPAPGILGLVAIGVVAAIAMARGRK
jgi:hypothetical protein